MPVIGISVKHLNELMKKSLSPEELSDAVEQLGCDLEDVTEIQVFECPACSTPVEKLSHEEAPKKCAACGYEHADGLKKVDQDEVIRLDLLPARPDFFDPGGLARALKGYLKIETGLPEYEQKSSGIVVNVAREVRRSQSFRPFIGCAVVEMPEIDGYLLRALMKLQENLHWGIGRDRKLASIGIYDLDTIEGPITYKTVDPEDFSFHPLGYPGTKMTPKEILEKHPKGVGYAHLLSEFDAYPILVDKNDQVLSMPPIINSDETKVKVGSKRLFIDVTGITTTDVNRTLGTLVSSMAEMGGKIESVEMHQASGRVRVTPNLKPGRIKISLDKARRWLGLSFTEEEAYEYLGRMRYNSEKRGSKIYLEYPAFRTDIKHEVDVFEDIAIAYGYHNIDFSLVSSMTIGQARPEEEIAFMARKVMLGMGFAEIFSMMLTTEQKHFTDLGLKPTEDFVQLLNPKVAEYNVMRCHLLTGLMECLHKNRHGAMPQNFFEMGNVARLNNDNQIEEERRLSFAITGPEAGYAEARATLDRVLFELGMEGSYEALESEVFIAGRAAKLMVGDKQVARIGELHPQILENLNLSYPVAVVEVVLAHVITH